MATVLMPLPELDFDPTEVAVSWKVLSDLGHRVRFATPTGRPGRGDDLMLTGRGLDPWGFLPGVSHLVVVGRFLRADSRGRSAYEEMLRAPEFLHPAAWDAIDIEAADGLLLPGGHRARGMRRYLESPLLQDLVVSGFRRQMPVAAVCHGVLVVARSIDPATGRSVLHGRQTTALTWSLEQRAWRVAKVARWWDPGYYRTYGDQPGQPTGSMSVQQEVSRALERATDFHDVDPSAPDAAVKSSGRRRDGPDDERPAFVVQDGNYLSARWPGDVHTFAKRFAGMLSRGRAPQRQAQAG
ncbi:MAG: type 1 glutamine amidotransferase domain-containing protein [Acidimicrobiales bacterium]